MLTRSLLPTCGIRSDDPNRAYRAADAWISRVHGRPKETIETQLPTLDDPLDIASTSREQRDAPSRLATAENRVNSSAGPPGCRPRTPAMNLRV